MRGGEEREPNYTRISASSSRSHVYETYTGKCESTVTTFGSRTTLFEMVVNKFASRCLYDSSEVRFCVVGFTRAEGNTLSHRWIFKSRES